MENSKNDGLNEKTKNKKHSNNISSEKSNEDQADKKENNLKEIPEESGTDNQKKSEDEETIGEEMLLNEVTILKEEKLRLLAEIENLCKAACFWVRTGKSQRVDKLMEPMNLIFEYISIIGIYI